jgi:hypothetical protein
MLDIVKKVLPEWLSNWLVKPLTADQAFGYL